MGPIDLMIEERRKFSEEGRRLSAEAAKFSRERGLQTLLAITGLIGGLLTLVQFFFRAKGSF